MTRKIMSRTMILLLGCFSLLSCGDSKGGGVAEFNTIYATASGSTGELDADVATWVDASGSPATPCIAGSFASVVPDSVDVAVSTIAYTGVANPSKLYVNRVRMTFDPADTLTPALPALFQTQWLPVGQTINPGASATIPIRVATHELKEFLSPVLACAMPIYNYNVSFSFDAVEIDTNRSASINTVKMRVRFADFVDK